MGCMRPICVAGNRFSDQAQTFPARWYARCREIAGCARRHAEPASEVHHVGGGTARDRDERVSHALPAPATLSQQCRPTGIC
jgi:hypothetical protein